MRITRHDLIVGAVCATVGLILVWLRALEGVGWAPVPAEAAAQLFAAAAIVGRRRSPLLALAVCAAASFVSPSPATLVAVFAVAAELPSHRRAAVATTATVLAAFPALAVSSGAPTAGTIWVACVLLVVAHLAGHVQRTRAHEAELREQAAIGQERARLAGELHDAVAQRLSDVVIQANLIGTTTAQPEVAAMAGRVADSGRTALAQLRTVIGLLSATPAPAPPTGLDALLQRARDLGQPVRADLSPGLRLDGLAGTTALRLVAEALTNAARHAPGATTTLQLADRDGGIHVRVTNGPAPRPDTGLTGGGHGLDALRRRIELLGGTLHAGPHDGGWEVDAWIPAPTR